MADSEKVYTPEEIDDNPFPTEDSIEGFDVTQNTSNDIINAQKIADQSFPSKRVAVELLSTALNTKSKKILQEFEFTSSGAIKVGEYQNGVSGELKISPNGLVARNNAGSTTFAIDGDTGDAVFTGTIQAGTLIGGQVAVGDGDILIDGEQKRMIFYDPDTGLPSIIIGNA